MITFVAASGTGSRMQMNIPKQFVSIYDMPLFIYPMAKIQANGRVDEIALAVPPGWNEYAKSIT